MFFLVQIACKSNYQAAELSVVKGNCTTAITNAKTLVSTARSIPAPPASAPSERMRGKHHIFYTLFSEYM